MTNLGTTDLGNYWVLDINAEGELRIEITKVYCQNYLDNVIR